MHPQIQTSSYKEGKKYKPLHSSEKPAHSNNNAPSKTQTKQRRHSSQPRNDDHFNQSKDLPTVTSDKNMNGAFTVPLQQSTSNDFNSARNPPTRGDTLSVDTSIPYGEINDNDFRSIGGWISPSPSSWADISKVLVGQPSIYLEKTMNEELASMEGWSNDRLQETPWNLESSSDPAIVEAEAEECGCEKEQWCNDWSIEEHYANVYGYEYTSLGCGGKVKDIELNGSTC